MTSLHVNKAWNNWGAFHSTKITDSNFRNFRWSNGTRPTASHNSRSRALQRRACCVSKMADFLNIFAALEQDDSETISCTILDINDDVILLAAVACFMRRRLNRVNGYFEVTILHFTVVCLVAKPLNRSEATGDIVVIQTMLLSYVNHSVIMLTSFASLSFQGHPNLTFIQRLGYISHNCKMVYSCLFVGGV